MILVIDKVGDGYEKHMLEKIDFTAPILNPSVEHGPFLLANETSSVIPGCSPMY